MQRKVTFLPKKQLSQLRERGEKEGARREGERRERDILLKDLLIYKINW